MYMVVFEHNREYLESVIKGMHSPSVREARRVSETSPGLHESPEVVADLSRLDETRDEADQQNESCDLDEVFRLEGVHFCCRIINIILFQAIVGSIVERVI